MELTVDQLLQQAVAAHNENKLQKAEGLYRTIFQTQPNHAYANHNLGLIAISMNKIEAALLLFKTALDANPNIEQFWLSYIDALIQERQFEIAKRALKKGKKRGVAKDKLTALTKQLMSAKKIQTPAQSELQMLLRLCQDGLYEDAEKLAISVTQRFPNHPFGWKALGLALNKSDRESEGLVASQRALEIDSQDAEVHSNLAVTFKALGRFDEAEASFRNAITLTPDPAETHNNLGSMLHELSKFDDAEASYRNAIKLKPDFTEAHSRLGLVLNALGRFEEAEACYNKAIELNPKFFEALINLGAMLQDLRRLEEAETCYSKALELKPDLAEAHANLGSVQRGLYKFKEAKASYTTALQISPDFDEAKHILAALSGETTDSPPRVYIENLFDNYAPVFDRALVDNLEYGIPKLITEMIVKQNPTSSLGSILDLGCGTGLTGVEIRNFCAKLEGVDLSNLMLEQARHKNVYDKLTHRDLVDYLLTEDLDFDFFIATDVFIYVGDLSEVFRLIKSRNRSGGKLVFSTEHTDKDGFFLEKSGRYTHSKKYIASLCEKFDYQLSYFEKSNLRKEEDHVLTGGLYILEF